MITLIPTDGPRLHGVSLKDHHLLAVSTDGTMLVIGHDYSHHLRVYVIPERRWLLCEDRDFPRFTIEDEGATHATLIDGDDGEPHEIQWVVGGEE